MPYICYNINNLPNLNNGLLLSKSEIMYNMPEPIDRETGCSNILLYVSDIGKIEPYDIDIISIVDRNGEETEINRNVLEFYLDDITLYHGTTKSSANTLSVNGWKPGSGKMGNQCGKTSLLYTSNFKEQAMYYANEKGDTTIIEIKTPFKNLIVDPEDGSSDNIWQEYFGSISSGFPANLAITTELKSSQIKQMTKNNDLEY